jgi:ribosomal protein S18 acetylase RimI-like enzyme
MSAYGIRMATKADNAALLGLTGATPMAGMISLRIDRDPDFFGLLKLRGDGRVFVATHGAEIAGCISGAVTTAFIAGQPETVGYVGDLKVHPRFAGNRLVGRLVSAVVADLQARGVDLVLSVVADGNERVMKLFASELGNPCSLPAGRFQVQGLLALPYSLPQAKYRIGRAGSPDMPAVGCLLDGFHRRRDFAPAFDGGQLHADSPLLVARAGGEIVASLALFDPRDVKRDVLVATSTPLRIGLGLLRLASAALPGFTAPRIGQALSMLYVRRFAFADGHREALALLLRTACAEASARRCTFVTLGMHERDPLCEVTRGLPRFTFSTCAYVTSLRSPHRLAAVASRIPYEDFALA